MTSWSELATGYENESSEDETNILHEVNSQGDTLSEKSNTSYYEFAGILVNVSGVVGQIILSHPWIVIRRQCQIRHDSSRFHWTPFTVIPVAFKLVKSQGFPTLWKGISSTLTLWLMGIGSETVLSETFNLPKDISKHSSLKKIGQHFLLKGISLVLLSPFYAASLVETVQSDLSTEPTSIITCLLEGFRRMFIVYREPVSRLLPIWKIVPVVASFGLLHYVIKTFTGFMTNSYLSPNSTEIIECNKRPVFYINKGNPNRADNQLDDVYYKYYCELFSTVMGSFTADVILFPMEVIVNRLCIQGTRVLIDNMDNPYEMVPITTAYYGTRHALNTILNETERGEGSGGLYKGFGALVIQYSIQFLLICCIRLGYENLLIKCSNVKPDLAATPKKINKIV
uniref:Slc25a-17 n=1 Tax=Schmidtea mediterranea TaxID=79327 RepID=A0A0H3YF53_SCHMD|nr:slc25a-17 [Schmidtea mediterranea]